MTTLNRDTYLGNLDWDMLQAANVLARGNNHPADEYINDMPVPYELANFFNELRHKRPTIIPRCDYHPCNITGQFTRIGIAINDAPDIQVGSIEVDRGKYIVYNKSIRNERYKPKNSKYNSLSSERLPAATKNALRYFLPVRPEYVYAHNSLKGSGAVEKLRGMANDRMHSFLSISRDSMFKEVEAMLAAGYTPQTQEFARAIEKMQAEGSDLRRQSQYRPRLCFVWSKARSVVYRYADESTFHEVTDMADFPQDIYSKVSMLNISDMNEPIIDVGIRINKTTYWIFV
jgi:hypothetical protein